MASDPGDEHPCKRKERPGPKREAREDGGGAWVTRSPRRQKKWERPPLEPPEGPSPWDSLSHSPQEGPEAAWGAGGWGFATATTAGTQAGLPSARLGPSARHEPGKPPQQPARRPGAGFQAAAQKSLTWDVVGPTEVRASRTPGGRGEPARSSCQTSPEVWSPPPLPPSPTPFCFPLMVWPWPSLGWQLCGSAVLRGSFPPADPQAPGTVSAETSWQLQGPELRGSEGDGPHTVHHGDSRVLAIPPHPVPLPGLLRAQADPRPHCPGPLGAPAIARGQEGMGEGGHLAWVPGQPLTGPRGPPPHPPLPQAWGGRSCSYCPHLEPLLGVPSPAHSGWPPPRGPSLHRLGRGLLLGSRQLHRAAPLCARDSGIISAFPSGVSMGFPPFSLNV